MIKYNSNTINDWNFGDDNIIKVYRGVKAKPKHNYAGDYLTFVAETDNVSFTLYGGNSSNKLSYSIDDGTSWTELQIGQTSPAINSGDKILWKASGQTINSEAGIGCIRPSDSARVEGNVMSMIYGDDFSGQTAIQSNYQLRKLFSGATNLTSAENLVLPATTIKKQCYSQMFQGCTSLVKTPNVIGSSAMTWNGDYCCSDMFNSCVSLTTVPSGLLPATNLSTACYWYMFQNCTSLTNTPILPATTLTSYCYNGMFNGCSSLNTITCLATNPSTNYTNAWVSGVDSTGTFYKDSNANWPTGYNGIPSNWTVQNYVASEEQDESTDYVGVVVYYKVITSGSTPEYKVCYAVVDDISQYSETEYEDVFDKATEKWYKLNNLNQYEEYGVYASGRTSCEGSTSRLPQGYTEVEYIQNNTQGAYINTGLLLYDVTGNSFSISAKLKSQYESTWAGDGYYLQTIINSEDVSSPYYGFTFRYAYQTHVLEGDCNPSNSVVFSSIANTDGTSSLTISCNSTTVTSQVPLELFASYNGNYNTPYRFSNATIYSFQVTKNNTLVRDLVPCKRDSDSMVGLFDIVNDVFYLSPNGNNFIGGSPVTPTDCVTTYEGKLTIDDGYEYIYSGNSWVNVGEVSGGTSLPIGYTEVEYVENTGTSYINTNYYPNQDTRILAEMQVVTFNSFGRLLGAGNHNTANTISCDYVDNGNIFEISWGGYTGWTQYSVVSNYDKHTYDWNKNYFYIDGTLLDSKTYNTFTCSYKLGIFNVLESGNVPTSNTGRYFYGKLYSFKIYNNDTLVRDYVPAKRDSDSKYGLYDLANDTFYTSPNNANFIGGAETSGQTVYPMYYEDKSDPLDNLSFSSMTEAQTYACNNCVYDGMKATIDGDRYYFDSSDENGWVEATTTTIWYDPNPTNGAENAVFNIGYYWGTNYKMVIRMYIDGTYSSDTGGFIQYNQTSPIEFNLFSNGFYLDMHNPTSTTSATVDTRDYNVRTMATSKFSGYQNSQIFNITLTYAKVTAVLESTGSQMFQTGSTYTVNNWYDGLYSCLIDNTYSGNRKYGHISSIKVYNANDELVNDLKFVRNKGVTGSQEISMYDAVLDVKYNNTTSYTPIYHYEE